MSQPYLDADELRALADSDNAAAPVARAALAVLGEEGELVAAD